MPATTVASAEAKFEPFTVHGRTLCGPQEPKCPPGLRWTGDRCGPLTWVPPPTGCPDGQQLSKGHCCPVGQTWSGRRCGGTVVEECPEGSVGKWPNCRKVEECPEGTTGKWPNCRKIVVDKCPDGTTGKWPNCRKVSSARTA